MPEPIRAETAADFLAMVPSLAGFEPRNSLVCVAFSGRRTAPGVLRLDLPERRRESDYRKLVSIVVAAASRMPDVDRVDPVIYSDAGFAAERGIPWLDLARAVIHGLEQAGFHVGGALCVASDGWGSYLEGAHRSVGHPLSEIERSPVRALAVEARGGEVGGVLEGTDLPDVDPVTRAEFVGLIAALRTEYLGDDDGPLLSELSTRADLDPVPWVEYCLATHDSLDLTALAWLAVIVNDPQFRDQSALQIAFGRRVGLMVQAASDHMEHIHERTGRSMDDIAADELSGGNEAVVMFGKLLLGQVAVRPLVSRVDAGIDVMRTLISHLPDERRSAPLCLLAWLLWSLGRGSAAGAMVDRARSLTPDYAMVRILDTILDAGMLPEWAFDGAEVDEEAEA